MANLLARQPIFDRALRVEAYELLFRPNGRPPGPHFDGDHATSSVIVNAFVDRSVDQVVGASRAWINMTPHLLKSNMVELLPRDRVVLEILETTAIDAELLGALKRMAALGYRLALDDFEWREDLVPLIPIVDYIKIDVLALDKPKVQYQLEKIGRSRAQLVAEKVETHEMMHDCVEMGFSMFQGYFLSRPNLVPGGAVSPNQLVVLRLLARIQDPQVDLPQLEQLIGVDATLSYRLLRLLNSAFYNLPRTLTSVHDALVILGLRTTRMWLMLISLAGLDDKPSELFAVAMIRAKICELLAKRIRHPAEESFFVVGLFSLLEAMLDLPLAQILASLPLSNEVNEALLSGAGIHGAALRCAVGFERVNWDDVTFEGLDIAALREVYLEAVQWARTVAQEIGKGG